MYIHILYVLLYYIYYIYKYIYLSHYLSKVYNIIILKLKLNGLNICDCFNNSNWFGCFQDIVLAHIDNISVFSLKPIFTFTYVLHKHTILIYIIDS